MTNMLCMYVLIPDWVLERGIVIRFLLITDSAVLFKMSTLMELSEAVVTIANLPNDDAERQGVLFVSYLNLVHIEIRWLNNFVLI